MPTYTDSLGFNKGDVAAFPEKGIRAVTMLEVDLDMAAIAAARLAAGATALAAADVLEVLRIPAKTLVLRVGLDITKAEGATCTVDVGDGSAASGYLSNINANAVGSHCSALALTEGAPNTITGYSGGKYYSAADTIDVVFDHSSTDTAVMRLWALVVDCS